ncbi:MAG: thermonuclease family protein [Pseudomonadota bacterium]
MPLGLFVLVLLALIVSVDMPPSHAKVAASQFAGGERPASSPVGDAAPFQSLPRQMDGPYWARVVSAHDGDSLRVHVAVWPGQIMEATVRLRSVDTPELNASCEEARHLAQAARDFVRQRTVGRTVRIQSVSRGKYFGRVVADIVLKDGSNLGELLVSNGLGHPYGGGRRQDGCELAASH